MQKLLLLLFSLCGMLSALLAQGSIPISQYESESYLKVIGSYEPIAKFTVVHAKRGDQNISEEVLDAGVYTLFYKDTVTGKYGMANVSNSQQTLTYGPIYDVKYSTQLQDPIPTQLYTFEWDFQNSFDSDKGTYLVTFEMNDTQEGGTIAELRMVDTEADEVMTFREACAENIPVLKIK